MDVISQIVRFVLPVFLVLVAACQPIAIRSVTNGECLNADAKSEAVCTVEVEEPPPLKGTEISIWLSERDAYCKKRKAQPAGAPAPIVRMKRLGGNTIKKQQLAHLVRLSCEVVLSPRLPASSPSNGTLEQVETAAQPEILPPSDIEELQTLLAHLVADKSWNKEFHALFELLYGLSGEVHRTQMENTRVREEMQQKIDALMQLERDISDRDVK